jgi:putative SOS response-associated peptidase YedK
VCPRLTLYTEGRLVAERFQLAMLPSLMPRYKIAPSQPLPVIGTKAGGQGRGLAMFRWGFILNWAQDAGHPAAGPRGGMARSGCQRT